MTNLKKFITDQITRQQSLMPTAHGERRKAKWLDELDGVLTTLYRLFLDAGLDPDAILETTHAMEENEMGSYSAPGLQVTLPAAKISFIPVASSVIGGFGRIDAVETTRAVSARLIAQAPDMECDDDRIAPYYRPWLWKVYPGRGAQGGYPFDEAGLLLLLERLTER